MREEVIRYVGHDDAALHPDPVQGPERDQPVAGTDVEHDLPGHDLRVVQDTLAQRQEKLLILLALLRVIAIASMEQPGGPLIKGVVLAHRRTILRGVRQSAATRRSVCAGTDIQGRELSPKFHALAELPDRLEEDRTLRSLLVRDAAGGRAFGSFPGSARAGAAGERAWPRRYHGPVWWATSA